MVSSTGTLDERYLSWLYRKFGVDVKNPRRSYWMLAKELYSKEFTWFIPNDDNRVADGLDLRVRFVDEEEGGETDRDWMGMSCSVLEMLIALSERLEFETDEDSYFWFWTFIRNLELDWCVDYKFGEGTADIIDETLNILINREYDRNGKGGLFPLRRASRDQRKVEIWYQMSTYLQQ